MELVLRLVETGIDGQSRSSDVMAISRPDDLGDLSSLGLTLTEAKQLLAQVQKDLVAAQAGNHALFRPDCLSCDGRCHVKDWRPHRIATMFGEVRLKLPRFRCAGCDRSESGVDWPPHRRSTPELDQLRARLSALMPMLAHDLLAHPLRPVSDGAGVLRPVDRQQLG
jgi:hypothetical protein